MKVSGKTIIWVILFSLAMGYLEAAVVIYLREIYYPAGFSFPLKPVSSQDIMIELLREASTLIMLIGIGRLSGKTKAQYFAFFLLAFAVWDLSYYAFLKLLIDWPASLLTWDILFLIPLPWVGPVLAPCLLSLTMVFLSGVIFNLENKHGKLKISFNTLIWLIPGALIVIGSFIEDPLQHLYLLMGENLTYVPAHYLWEVFLLGEGFIIFGIVQLGRTKSKEKEKQIPDK